MNGEPESVIDMPGRVCRRSWMWARGCYRSEISVLRRRRSMYEQITARVSAPFLVWTASIGIDLAQVSRAISTSLAEIHRFMYASKWSCSILDTKLTLRQMEDSLFGWQDDNGEPGYGEIALRKD